MGVKDHWERHSKKVLRSPRWKAVRLEVLRHDDFKCVHCGARGRLEVDHKIPVRLAPERAFDLDNLQALCRSCHTRKTRLEVGHPPLSESRQQWRDSIRDMMRNNHSTYQHKE